MEIANLTVTFGEDEQLLDRLEDIVVPAFFNGYQRKHGRNTYFFYDVKYVVKQLFGRRELAIVGRFIKDTELERDQYLEDGELIRDRQTMPSAPSAIFALVLSGHRLLYLKEYTGAPDVQVFGSTLDRFLRKARNELVNSVSASTIPLPEVRVTPISSQSSFNTFIDRFSRVKRLRVKVLKVNAETDNSAFFHLRDLKNRFQADTTGAYFNATDGLNTTEVKDAIKPALEGNMNCTLAGQDAYGNELSGSNDNFKLTTPINNDLNDISGTADIMIEKYNELVSDNVVSPGPVEEGSSNEQLARILQSMDGRNGENSA